MFFRSPQYAKDYKAFKSGDIDGLSAILRSEHNKVFDYVMRMIGQLAKANDVTEEAIGSIEQTADTTETLEELLVLVYKTARNFAIDVWNADTSKLENGAYMHAQGKENQVLVQLEGLVRTLPPIQRESLLLRERFGFAMDEIAEITGHATSDVEMSFAQALGAIEQTAPEFGQRIPDLLARLSAFEKPKYDGPETQNLSLIMNDFRKTNGMGSSPWRWARVVFYVVVIIVSWNFRTEIVAFSDAYIAPQLRSLFDSSPTP